jgi:hypothetical protein
MQASYRRWQIRCVPQCDRACEQVARSWADAALEDIATSGTLSTATTTVPKTNCVITSFPPRMAARPNLIFQTGPLRNSKRAAQNMGRYSARLQAAAATGFLPEEIVRLGNAPNEQAEAAS